MNRAIDGFLAELADDGSAQATFKKYRLVLGKLRAYAADQGYTTLDAFTNLVVRDMRTGWNVPARTADKNMSTVKSLFDYAVTEGLIEFNPARIKKRKNRATRQLDARHEQKEPFSDAEIEGMYVACRNEYGRGSKVVEFKSTRGKQVSYVIDIGAIKRTWTGQDLEDFIAVSVWTGLRISDVATFQMDRVNEEGGILVRTTKGGKPVYTEVPDWLLARIRDRVAKHGSWIFGKPNTTSIDVITENWRRKLNKLWAACGPWKVKPTPHRFRHTFARVLLENGEIGRAHV